MNEQIKKLAEQAGGSTNYRAFRGHFLPPPPDYIDPATVDLEKFTKLIVHECSNVIAKRSIDQYSDDEWDSGYVYGLQTSIKEIKKHFGVE